METTTAAAIIANPDAFIGRTLKGKGAILSVDLTAQGAWITWAEGEYTGTMLFTPGRKVTLTD